MKVRYSLSSERFTITEYDFVQDFKATCDVRNELNNRRPLHVPEQVRYAMTENQGDKIPIMPRQMPVGIHDIGKPRIRSDKYRRPFYIPTDAEQWLTVWALDCDGGYDHPTTERVLDLEYGIHYSESLTTLGCIRASIEGDILIFVDLLQRARQREEYSTLTVIQ